MAETAIVKSGKDVKELLASYQERFVEVLPIQFSKKDISRFVTPAAIYYTSHPELHGCTKDSLVRAVMQSCEVGLPLLPALKLAYMIPFKNKNGELEAQFMPSYLGLLELVYRSGKIKVFQAQLVYENDEFKYQYGSDTKIFHNPATLDKEPGKPIGAYAIAVLDNDQERFEIMRLAEIETVRKSSKAPNSPAWAKWWGEMARKTVAKRLCKWLPSEVDEKVLKAIEYDNRALGFENGVEVVEVEGDGERTKQLSEKLNDKAEKQAEPEPHKSREEGAGKKKEQESGEWTAKLQEAANDIGPEKVATLANNLGFKVKLYTDLNEKQAKQVYEQIEKIEA